MRGNFPLPDGSTVRVESSQRYVIVTWQGDHWKVTSRRTTRNTALAAWREAMRQQSETDVAPHLIDTVEQQVLR